MTDRVVARLDMLCESDPACATVEKVQDLVEQTLMERGYFETAKHFILYRYQAAEKRKDKVIEAIEDSRLTVTRTDGTKEQFSRNLNAKFSTASKHATLQSSSPLFFVRALKKARRTPMLQAVSSTHRQWKRCSIFLRQTNAIQRHSTKNTAPASPRTSRKWLMQNVSTRLSLISILNV